AALTALALASVVGAVHRGLALRLAALLALRLAASRIVLALRLAALLLAALRLAHLRAALQAALLLTVGRGRGRAGGGVDAVLPAHRLGQDLQPLLTGEDRIEEALLRQAGELRL